MYLLCALYLLHPIVILISSILITDIPSLDSLLCSGDLEKEIKPFDILSDLDYSDIKSTSESPDGHNTYFDRM